MRRPMLANSRQRTSEANAEESGVRIVWHLLAIALIGTWITPACLAAEVARDGAGSDAIDTRNTVESRRLGGQGAVREGNAKLLRRSASRLGLPRRWSAHERVHEVTRDAIGLPVAHHDGTEQEHGQRHDLPALVHNLSPATTGYGTNRSGSVAKTSGTFGHSPNANPVVRPAGLNRGTINGTNFARPGSGPSGIGGPAKSLAGISGTTIRHKP